MIPSHRKRVNLTRDQPSLMALTTTGHRGRPCTLKGLIHNCGKLVLNGFTLLEGTTEVPLSALQIKENDRLYVLDLKAMSILYYGLNRTEFNRISSCKTSNEIWTRLELPTRVVTRSKRTNISTLTRKYENFKMIPVRRLILFLLVLQIL